MAVTRKKVSCVIFDAPSEMPDNQLPTYADVMKFYNRTKQRLKYELNNKDPPHHNVAEIVITKVEQIWDKASIPQCQPSPLEQTQGPYQEEIFQSRTDSGPYQEEISQFRTDSGPYQEEISQFRTDSGPYQEEISQSRTDSGPYQEEISQSRTDSGPNQEEISQSRTDSGPYQKEISQSRTDSGTYQEKISQFQDESKKLFDICSCKCSFISQCQCEKSRKIPAIERDFLEVQRGPRGMIIAKVDDAESIKLQKRYIRKELTQKQKCRKSDIDGISEKQSDVCEEISSTEEKTDASDDESDNDCRPDPNKQLRKLNDKQMRVKLPSLALACDRYGVSDRAAAGITSAVLQDVGILHERDVSKVIDR
ncbi:hypothetical protein Bpfe_014950, partial [Biomphalaria pfeifferi]